MSSSSCLGNHDEGTESSGRDVRPSVLDSCMPSTQYDDHLTAYAVHFEQRPGDASTVLRTEHASGERKQ